jgi:hypothetical protein
MRIIIAFSSLSMVLACSKPAQPSPEPSAPSAPVQAAPSAQPAAPAAAAESGNASAAGLSWTAPKPFVSRTPKSTMRVAEYGIEGDPSAELGVFYFGADQGGSVDANMTRWIGQFTQPDGSDTKAKRDERSVHGIPVATVEAHGTYSGGMAMPGAPPKAAQPDSMLLGAIAKGPKGSVFFKLTGSQSALEAARPAFDQLLESIH